MLSIQGFLLPLVFAGKVLSPGEPTRWGRPLPSSIEGILGFFDQLLYPFSPVFRLAQQDCTPRLSDCKMALSRTLDWNSLDIVS